MSAAAVTRTRLARLLRELEVERQALTRIAEELVATRPALDAEPVSRGTLALVAVDLHAFYTALESQFERVARTVDGELPEGPRSHRELLSQMAADLSPLRPPVIDPDLEGWLGDLLSFRHFFRHAYAVELEAAHLRVHADAWAAHREALDRALDDLVTFLSDARDAVPMP